MQNYEPSWPKLNQPEEVTATCWESGLDFPLLSGIVGVWDEACG